MIGDLLRNESAGGALARFTRDLSADARAGRLEPVRCRDQEVSRLIDILLRPEVCFAHSLATGNLPLLDPTKYEFPKELKAMPGYNPTGVATAGRNHRAAKRV